MTDTLPPLSARESEVARLVAEDLADKEIADLLRISIHTVQEYVKRIARKIATQKSDKARRRAIRQWVEQQELPPSPNSHAA